MPKLFRAAALSIVLSAKPGYGVELPEVFVPVRPAGMGGAFTAISDDENAIWTNPAGVARIRKARSRQSFHLSKFPNFVLGVNRDGVDFNRTLKKTINTEDSIQSLAGRSFWIRAGAFPTAQFEIARNWPQAFALYVDSRARIEVDQDNPETTLVETITDAGGVLALAWTNATNRFSMGVQVRPMVRFAYEDRLPTSDLIGNSKQLSGTLKKNFAADANKSYGVGVDAGLLWTLADFWFPTIGVAAFNLPTGCKDDYLNPYSEERQSICGNRFVGDIGNEEALSVVDPTDLRIGFSITPRLTRKVALRVALDAHHLYGLSKDRYYGLPGVEVQKLLHAGVELVIGNPMGISPFTLRGGLGQGHLSWGISLRPWIFSLDFAWFQQDVSSTASPEGDQRFISGISAEF